LIIHIPPVEDLDSVAQSCELAWRLADVFWPGPLTLVLPKRDHVPDIVTAGLPTVAVRVPDNTIAIRLIELCGRPVAAPSANCFGCMSPTSVEHVERHLGYVIDMILDGGPCRVGVESTILSITDEDGPRLQQISSTLCADWMPLGLI
jgi:L-threonylcarbamoyladenylate synthase